MRRVLKRIKFGDREAIKCLPFVFLAGRKNEKRKKKIFSKI
jgi:hypothetical protein